MSAGNDNNIDWSIPTTPVGERVVPSLARPKQAASAPKPRRSVMDTLLGENNLTALDSSGTDPYNQTGRQFRR